MALLTLKVFVQQKWKVKYTILGWGKMKSLTENSLCMTNSVFWPLFLLNGFRNSNVGIISENKRIRTMVLKLRQDKAFDKQNSFKLRKPISVLQVKGCNSDWNEPLSICQRHGSQCDCWGKNFSPCLFVTVALVTWHTLKGSAIWLTVHFHTTAQSQTDMCFICLRSVSCFRCDFGAIWHVLYRYRRKKTHPNQRPSMDQSTKGHGQVGLVLITHQRVIRVQPVCPANVAVVHLNTSRAIQ